MIEGVKAASVAHAPVTQPAYTSRYLPGLLATIWLIAVTLLALNQVRAAWVTMRAVGALQPERAESLMVVLGLIAVGVVISVVAGRLLPQWWRTMVLGLMILPAVVLGITSGNLLAEVVACCLLVPFLILGREASVHVLGTENTADGWVIGSGIGLLALACLSIVLLAAEVLWPQIVWVALLALMTGVVAAARQRLKSDLDTWKAALRTPAPARIDMLIAVGIVLGIFWLVLIGSLAPEYMSDAVRQRLPAAELMAREGRLVSDPDLFAATNPGLGEALYAIVFATGPLETAKVVNLLVGLLCAAAVWNLGRHLGGAYAGLIALLAFATLPIMTSQAQMAYVDLFAVLFALVAANVLTLPRPLDLPAVLVAAALVLTGVTVKYSFAFAAAALAVTIGLLIITRVSPRLGEVGLVATVLAIAAGAVWITNGLTVLNGVPGLAPVVEVLARARNAVTPLLPDLGFGVGKTLTDLLRVPLDLVQQTHRYGEFQDGFAGYLLLALAPLPLLARPDKRMAPLLIGLLAGGVIWFATVQYLRYGLPLLVILAAVAAAALASIVNHTSPTLRTALLALPLVLALFSVIGYLNTVLIYPGTVPFRVVLGQESKSNYLAEILPAYPAIDLLNADGGATRAATSTELAQLYSPVRMSNVASSTLGQDPASDEARVLGLLDAGGFSHIIIDRTLLPANWDENVMMNEEFLRRNTVLVGGDHNVYLYRLLPPGERGYERDWALGSELLRNGGFEEPDRGAPAGWTPSGKPKYDTSGQGYDTPQSAVRLREGVSLSTTVRVVPGAEYLLSYASRGRDDYGVARLYVTWLTGDRETAGIAIEDVPTSPLGYHRFSMLATAPPDAQRARIIVQTRQGEAWIDDLSFRAVEQNPQSVSTP